MMYVALWTERHSDYTVYLFSNKAVAIAWAKEQAKAYAQVEEDYYEHITPFDNQVFSVDYSCENDNITIFKCEVNSE